MGSNNATIRERYIYTQSQLSLLTNSKYTASLNDSLYKKLISMRDRMRSIQRAINISSVEFKENFRMPVDIQQFIMNLVNRENRKISTIVDPYYVLQKIKDVYTGIDSRIMKYRNQKSVIKKADEQRIKLLFKFYLYDTLAPKKCTIEHKFSKDEFDEIITYIKKTIDLAKVEGGEMVGFIGAQSIAAPISQSNLKSFHKAGTGAGVSIGLPRLKELLCICKNIKTPAIKIVLQESYKNNKVIAGEIASYLKYTTLRDVVDKVDIYYDPNPQSKSSIMTKDNVQSIFSAGSSGKSGCQTEINQLPWIIRIILSKEKMIERKVTMLEIKTSFCNNWSMRYEDSKGSKKEYKKIIDKISQCAIITNFDNSPTPIVHVRFDANNYNFNTLVQFQEMIINKYKIKGIANILESNKVVEESYTDFDSNGNVRTDQKHFVIMTEGINLQEIAQINGINLEETVCNDIVTIYETYGIEAARAAYIREFTTAIESAGGFSNYQHIEILTDAITHMGYLIAVNRHGANKLDTDPFSRASFEKTVEQLLAAAAFGESDHIRSVSSRIMVGSLINGGTGCFDLLLDHEKVKQTIPPKQEKVEIKLIKKRSAVSDMISRKKGTQN